MFCHGEHPDFAILKRRFSAPHHSSFGGQLRQIRFLGEAASFMWVTGEMPGSAALLSCRPLPTLDKMRHSVETAAV
jgi:hypothetical protein